MIALCKKFPVKYEDKKYYAKLFKYDCQQSTNECRKRIYNRVLFFIIKLREENCRYSAKLTDRD